MQGIDDYDGFHNRVSGWLFAGAIAFLLAAVTSAALKPAQRSDSLDQEAAYAAAN